MGVTTAFLNGVLEEEIYMKQPEGYVLKGKEHLVLRLKSLHILKQAPRVWHGLIHSGIMKMGFKKCKPEPCVHNKHIEKQLLLIALYVDGTFGPFRRPGRVPTTPLQPRMVPS